MLRDRGSAKEKGLLQFNDVATTPGTLEEKLSKSPQR